MISDPKTEYRKEEHYVSIKVRVKQHEIPALLPSLIPELFNWLGQNKIKPAGAPFFKYLNMEGGAMDVEVGIPVLSHLKGDKRFQPGSFPEGKYLVLTYTGPYSNLPGVHSELEKWKEKNNVRVKGGGTEFYPTDPASEPNPAKWQTIIISQVDED